MTSKYEIVSGNTAGKLQQRVQEKLDAGMTVTGGPQVLTPYSLIQAVVSGGENTENGTGTSSTPSRYYVVVLAGQSNGMAYGEGLPLPDSYDAPDGRIKQLARRSTVTPGGDACAY
ncbi:TPA: DUF1737 domain-containing protein, partial [Escherichia coli]|nr:DUF1737 domain-containing protein [Escherichia coli]